MRPNALIRCLFGTNCNISVSYTHLDVYKRQVDNIMQIWRDGKADKLTQLVFCDSVAIRCYK